MPVPAAFVISALPTKADICGATRDVREGPKADILRNQHARTMKQLISSGEEKLMDARSPIIRALTMASASLVPRRSISERPRRRRATALVEGLIALNPDLRDALVALIIVIVLFV
jgi:hypothetical protein